MKPRLTDTHCHLTLPEFDADREAALARARAEGVQQIVVPGIDLATSQAAVELAERNQGLWAAVGVHPHHAGEWDTSAERKLTALASSPTVCAIGEVGLDYYRNYASAEDQRRAFGGQLRLAAQLGLPVLVHNRRATQEVLAHLLEWSSRLPESLRDRAGILHAFSADRQVALQAIAVGFYIGVGGPITYRNAQDRREITARLPVDRLLIETDSPYMTPHPHRGKRNEPAFLSYVAGQLAQVLDMPIEHLSAWTSINAAKLFGWNHGSTHDQLH